MTFHKFIRLLDNCLAVPFYSLPKHRDGDEITFDTFAKVIYPHFNKEFTKVGDAACIYTEIMSIIKGSLPALSERNNCLNRAQYIALHKKRGSTLNADQRELVYNCFEAYEGMKQEGKFGHYDALDVAHYVYKGMQAPQVSVELDSVYIDEVQDLMPIQIALLKYICHEPKRYMFAGDTAQTIAAGVSFRFESLKDLFFEAIACRTGIVPKLSHLLSSQNSRWQGRSVARSCNNELRVSTHHLAHSTRPLDQTC